MRIFKRLLVFLLVSLLLMGLVRLVIRQDFTMDMLLEEAEFQSANAIILGQSLPQTGLDPSVLSTPEETCFNLGRGAISMECLPVLLKEAHRVLPLRRVYLNLDCTYWSQSDWLKIISGSVDNDAVALFYRSLPHMTDPAYLGKVLCRQPFGNLLFPYSLDSTTVKDLPRTLRQKFSSQDFTQEQYIENMRSRNRTTQEYEYRGGGFMYGIQGNLGSGILDSYAAPPDGTLSPVFHPEQVPEGTLQAFREIVSYCNEQGLELICFSTAQSPEVLVRCDFGVPHRYYAELCQQYQVPYYDLSYLKADYLSRHLEDYVDTDGHMMGPLAQAQSRLLREILSSPDPESYFESDYDSLTQSLLSRYY